MLYRMKSSSLWMIFVLLFMLFCLNLTAVLDVYATVPSPYYIVVSSPAAGDVFAPGSTHDITWSHSGADKLGPTVNLSLYKGGVLRSSIKGGVGIGTSGSRTYQWTLPAGLPEGNDYQVKVLAASRPTTFGMSGVFSVGTESENGTGNEGTTQPTGAAETVLINDSSFVTLTAVPNPAGGTESLFNLQVKANNSSSPVEVSYLMLSPAATPSSPSSEMTVDQLSESQNSWGGLTQYYRHTEVGGWAMPQYQKNPQSFALPHYRTCVMMLARYEKIYVVFVRENDGQLTYQVFQGSDFNSLNVPGLAQMVRSGDQLQIHSQGGAVEVGIWDKGTYQHDEVTGWAQAGYQANDKLYPIPKYGMFMMAIGRYGNMGLVVGNYNDGRLGAVCFSGSKLLGTESVSGLCEITNAGSPNVRIRATGSAPVEVSQFAFDNTCWQWEVGGWGQEAFKANPQVLPLKHYTPGFFTLSRYAKEGIFFYNENDGQLGILPLNSSTQVSGATAITLPTAPSPSPSPSPVVLPGEIRVYVNGKLLTFDQPPVIINGSTLVPMRAIFEALGATVVWDGASQTVSAAKGDITIKLVLGMNTSLVNGHETALSQPAQLMGGRTMVPLRFVAEALNAEVNWAGDTRIITINLAGSDYTGIEQEGKQVVNEFFTALGSGNIDAAMGLMDADMLGNASTQAMWRSSFSAVSTLTVSGIQDWNKSDWTSVLQIYKVEYTSQLNMGSQSAMWTDGRDTRWVSVKFVNGQWKISELATGP